MTEPVAAAIPSGRISAEARRAQLLQVGEDLFARHGLSGTSVEDVAKAAGITRPVVYNHFGSKEGLFLACVEHAHSEVQRDLLVLFREVPAAPGGDLQPLLTNAGRFLLNLKRRHPARWVLLFGTGAELTGEPATHLAELRSHTLAQVAELIRYALPDASDEVLIVCAHAVSGVGEMLARWLTDSDATDEELIGYFSAIVMSGLAGLIVPVGSGTAT